MKYFKLIILLFGLLIIGCKQADHKSSNIIDDKEQIKNLVRQMYKWQDKANLDDYMAPVRHGNDSVYVGIDIEKHKIGLELLQKTGYFSDEFNNNYDKIARTVDRKLKNKEIEWRVGDLPPFGNDAVPWCDCQDYPEDHPWDKIKFNFISIDSVKSILTWTWGRDSEWDKGFNYTIRVVKKNGIWEIAYLQGFDFDKYIGKN